MFYRIRAIRSTIGMPKIIRQNMEALGLRKRGAVVYHQISPDVAGKLMTVKELVNVQLVDKALTSAQERELRRPLKGYTVEKAFHN